MGHRDARRHEPTAGVRPWVSGSRRPWLAWLGSLCLALLVLGASVDAGAYGVPLRPLNVQLRDRTHGTLASLDSGRLGLRGMLSVVVRHFVPRPDTTTVRWTVPRDVTAERLSAMWGVRLPQLAALNPEVAAWSRDTQVAAGTSLVVYRQDPTQPTQSIGRPNRGRLQHGMPFPEGPYWTLRETRQRHYGTRLAVETTVDALMSYGHAYPLGPRVRVGELSKSTGGHLRPHRSHRSGRDLDLGYVGRASDGDGNWVRVDETTIDPEKTWFLLKALLASGNVQSMYMDRRLQEVVGEVAARELTAEELGAIFEHPRRAHSHRAIIQHWPGHRDHLHVRFQCESWNARCRAW